MAGAELVSQLAPDLSEETRVLKVERLSLDPIHFLAGTAARDQLVEIVSEAFSLEATAPLRQLAKLDTLLPDAQVVPVLMVVAEAAVHLGPEQMLAACLEVRA